MAKFTRRQLLLGGLGVSVVATGIHETVRLQALAAQQAELTQLALQSPDYIESTVNAAIEGDLEATARVKEIQESVIFTPPPIPYDREMSKLLIQCSRLGTEQYLTGKFDPNYDGSITSLPTYTERLNGFTQTASITGPDKAEVQTKVDLSAQALPAFLNPLQKGFDQVQSTVQALAGQTVTLRWTTPV